MLTPPISLIRKKYVINKLKQCDATSLENAKTFEEAGVINPKAFAMATQKLLKDKVLIKTEGNKYYFNNK